MVACQNCGEELDEVVENWDLDKEYVAHTYPADDELGGSVTSYYCNPGCFLEVHDG